MNKIILCKRSNIGYWVQQIVRIRLLQSVSITFIISDYLMIWVGSSKNDFNIRLKSDGFSIIGADQLELSLEKLVSSIYKEELKLLRSIPGIGVKTSILLVLMSNGMRNFESSGQLCSYAGLTPVIRESGKSVRSRPRISKMGNGLLRRHLFMCSFNAVKYNGSCKALYERITGKGKSGKVGLIAVCNKLLKQSFGVLKSGQPYSEKFSLKTV